jgi:hypothetical protein
MASKLLLAVVWWLICQPGHKLAIASIWTTVNSTCEFWRLHRGVNEGSILLECDHVSLGERIDPYKHRKPPCHWHSLVSQKTEFFFDFFPPKDRFNGEPGYVVGIATRYGLDGRGSNFGGGEIFRFSPDWPWGPPASYTTGTGSFARVKRPRRGVDHPFL